MEKHFDAMFSRQPDKIKDGDYYFRVPWIEAEQKSFGLWTLSDKGIAGSEKHSREHFMPNWEKRTFEGEFNESEDYVWLKDVKGKDRNPVLFKLLSDIAGSGTPIVDIASSESMGMLPYLLKLNPSISCMASDVDFYAMERLRNRINENFPEYSISISSFDNTDMPFADNSVPVITGFCPITSCSIGKSWVPSDETDPNIKTFDDFENAIFRKAISEVYRVLKPGGLFVFADGYALEWEYDMDEINAFFEKKELLYGMFSRDLVLEKLAEVNILKNQLFQLKDELLRAGFEIVFESRISEKLPSAQAIESLMSINREPVNISESRPDEDIISCYSPSYTFVLRKPDTGIGDEKI